MRSPPSGTLCWHHCCCIGQCYEMLYTDKCRICREDAFQTAAAVVAGTNAASASQVTGRKESRKEAGTGESSDIFKLVKMVLERNLDPVRDRAPCKNMRFIYICVSLFMNNAALCILHPVSNRLSYSASANRRWNLYQPRWQAWI